MGSDDSCDNDPPLDDEEDSQTDEIEVDSTKESSDCDLGKEEEIDIEDEDEFTKMIQSKLDYIIQPYKKRIDGNFNRA